jgi:hypothetical protein
MTPCFCTTAIHENAGEGKQVNNQVSCQTFANRKKSSGKSSLF